MADVYLNPEIEISIPDSAFYYARKTLKVLEK